MAQQGSTFPGAPKQEENDSRNATYLITDKRTKKNYNRGTALKWSVEGLMGNIRSNSPPKSEKFQIKNSYFQLKSYIVSTR